MRIQSIELVNFRQFQKEYIEFATEKKKNVTLIMGENGAGKTSIAQAFFWCLYGEVSFQDKILLNRNQANYLTPGKSAEVSVRLCLEHNKCQYTIIRTQIYLMGNNGLSAKNSEINIKITDSNGNTKWVGYNKPNPLARSQAIEYEINDILPRELSRYFFFDGEKIESLSKEISSGRKSNSFVEAVNSLTGLKGILKAIEHLNPHSARSVVGQFNAEYMSGGSEKIKALTKDIEDATVELNANIERCNQIAEEREDNNQFIVKNSKEIKQFNESAKLQTNKEYYKKEIISCKEYKYNHLQQLFTDFNRNLNGFACQKLVKDALEAINKTEVKGKDIPNMHAKTIEFLLERGVCICGTHLPKNSEHYKCLEALLDYLPPHSLSVAIGNFVKSIKVRNQEKVALLDMLKTSYEQIADKEEKIEDFREKIENISKKLSGDNVRERVRELNKMISACENNNQKLDSEKFRLAQRQGELKLIIKTKEQERTNLALQDKNNQRIEIAKEYAQAVFNLLNTQYKEKEKTIKDKLQAYINENFKKFFNGDISLQIDPKYAIKVMASGKIESLETSTGQGIAVIFAFLSAVIKIAKENDNNAETYPIVMDAPLSTLDKERIKSVCVTLPSIADQVIVFIKDTDGEVAEQNLVDRIGKKLHFRKIDQYTTEIR